MLHPSETLVNGLATEGSVNASFAKLEAIIYNGVQVVSSGSMEARTDGRECVAMKKVQRPISSCC